MNKANNRTGGYLALATTSIVWGTTWVASKIAVSQVPAFQMASIRQFLGGICLVLFFMLYKKLRLPNAKQFAMLFILSLLMFVGANGLSTWSLQYIPTGLSSLIGALYPLSVVIIEMIFFKNRNVTALTFAGLLLGILGIGIVFYENAFQGVRPPGFLLGVLLSFIAMLAWSAGTLIIARNRVQMNPYYATGWQMLISAAIMFAFAILSNNTIPIENISSKSWLAIAHLVIFGSLVTFAAFIYSMKKLPPALFSLYAYFNPLVAIVTAGLLLKEKMNLHILWGAIVTLLGVFLVNYSIRSNKKQLTVEPGQ